MLCIIVYCIMRLYVLFINTNLCNIIMSFILNTKYVYINCITAFYYCIFEIQCMFE